MPNWSQDLLEYESLRALLARYVSSAAGHRQLDAMQPSTDREALSGSLAELSEALTFLTEGDRKSVV